MGLFLGRTDSVQFSFRLINKNQTKTNFFWFSNRFIHFFSQFVFLLIFYWFSRFDFYAHPYLGWTIVDIKGISPFICTHIIYLEENVEPSREMQ